MTANLVNRKAFCAMIRDSEGTSSSPITKHDGYDVIVTGADGVPEVFTDFSVHPFEGGRPPKMINAKGLYSTAAGGPQILLRFWLFYKKKLNLPDFSPESQDAYVIQQLEERKALSLVDNGFFDTAIMALNGLWASLPGKHYVAQGQRTLAYVRGLYVDRGGTLA